jgi:hypothetical protein
MEWRLFGETTIPGHFTPVKFPKPSEDRSATPPNTSDTPLMSIGIIASAASPDDSSFREVISKLHVDGSPFKVSLEGFLKTAKINNEFVYEQETKRAKPTPTVQLQQEEGAALQPPNFS